MGNTYAEDFYRCFVFVTCLLVSLSTFAVILKYFCANLQQKCEYMYTSNRCLANDFFLDNSASASLHL